MSIIKSFNSFHIINENRKITFDDWKNAKPKIKNFIKSVKGSEEKSGDDKNINNENEREYLKLYQDFIDFREEADYLRKEQKYVPTFFKFKEREELSHQELKDIYDRMLKHKNTISQNKIDLTNSETSEELTDKLDYAEMIEKTNKFTKIIPNPLRSKIRNNDGWMEEFTNMIIDYSYDDFKNVFMKKASYYKNEDPVVFFEALKSHINSFAPKSEIIKKIKENPAADIVAIEDDFIVARIYSFNASCDLGSRQWCISRGSGNMWTSYIVSGGYGNNDRKPGVQYFIWDFKYDQTDVKSYVGVTAYKDGTYSAHYKNDSKADVSDQEWVKYLKNWNDLSKDEKVKLVANNPEMEGYTGIINSLDEKSKREMLDKIPKLLLYFKDLSFLSNEEVWDLVRRDSTLADNLSIAKELTDQQKIISVVNKPQLLEMNWENNPYLDIKDKLSRKQKLKMISNHYSLYDKFEDSLTEDELIDIINMDPKILVHKDEMIKKIDRLRLKSEYEKHKDRWDKEINKSQHGSKTKIKLLLTHLLKKRERLEMESKNNCFVFIAKQQNINGKEYTVPYERSEGLILIDNVLDPKNKRIAPPMLTAQIEPDINGYSTWIPNDKLSKEDLDGYYYKFKSSAEEIINGEGSELDTYLFNFIQDNKKKM